MNIEQVVYVVTALSLALGATVRKRLNKLLKSGSSRMIQTLDKFYYTRCFKITYHGEIKSR